MDVNVETGRSDIAPFGFKKDGSFYADSKVANEQTFTVLQQHMHRLIESAGLQILSGEVLLNPYANKDGNACQFCSFKSVCQFDPNLTNNKIGRASCRE